MQSKEVGQGLPCPTLLIYCLLILAVASALRIPNLAGRPMHADEAILADKFGGLLEKGSYDYDPRDYHGPVLAYLTLMPAWLAGAHRYADLSEITLRIVPALCGIALVFLPLLLRRAIGLAPAIAAAGLTAVSPAMVYYSRDYIPEMPLTLLTFLTIALGWRYAVTERAGWAVAAGASLGLMFATKETGAIAAVCMLAGLAATVKVRPRKPWHIAAGLAMALLSVFLILGHAGPWEALRGYTERAQSPIHRHPWFYYLETLSWTEAPILLLAVVGIPMAWKRGGVARFLAVYGAAMVLAYSLIPYKTPWCVLGFLDALILLAGIGLVFALEKRRVILILAVAGAAHLAFYAWRDSFPYSSDPANPYVYAQTGRDVYAIRDRLEALAR
ncbi:MAG: glycosyltransferase family 39 protein, partial [Acidobacteria bacterium]|nr:glycosyltransferase family 39 protein [Acidobacteriota bacterium]